jgi:uncharacterized cupredoxin-like copper-binding protein
MKRVGLVMAAMALVAAGCGVQKPPAPTGPQPAPGSGTKVTATLTDFHVELSQQSFSAGTYTFSVKNAGKVTHSLEIQRDGQADYRSDNIQPGNTDQLTVVLEKGTYDVYCPVGNHRSQGMSMELEVTG